MGLAKDFFRSALQALAIKTGVAQRVHLGAGGSATFADSEGLKRGLLLNGVKVKLFCDQILEAEFQGRGKQYSLKASVRPIKLYNLDDNDVPAVAYDGPRRTYTLATGLLASEVGKLKHALEGCYSISDCLDHGTFLGLVKNDEVLAAFKAALGSRREFTTPDQARQSDPDVGSP